MSSPLLARCLLRLWAAGGWNDSPHTGDHVLGWRAPIHRQGELGASRSPVPTALENPSLGGSGKFGVRAASERRRSGELRDDGALAMPYSHAITPFQILLT